MAGIADQGKGIRKPPADQLNGGEGKRKEDGKSEDGPPGLFRGMRAGTVAFAVAEEFRRIFERFRLRNGERTLLIFDCHF